MESKPLSETLPSRSRELITALDEQVPAPELVSYHQMVGEQARLDLAYELGRRSIVDQLIALQHRTDEERRNDTEHAERETPAASSTRRTRYSLRRRSGTNAPSDGSAT